MSSDQDNLGDMAGEVDKELNERVLEDDYPTYYGYLYVINGRPWQNFPDFKNVRQMREGLLAAGAATEPVEIKSCDISGRDLWEIAI